MNRKGKFIAIVTVLALVASLLAVFPGSVAVSSPAVAGTVSLDATVYSAKTGNNVVTVSVTDADLSPTRTGTARIALGELHGGPAAGHLSSVAAPIDLTDVGNNVVTDTVTGGAADSALATVIEGESEVTETLVTDASVTQGQDAAQGTCSTATPAICTLSNRFGDADADGAYEFVDDVTFVSSTEADATALTVLDVGGDAANDNPQITLNNATTALTDAVDTVTVTYET